MNGTFVIEEEDIVRLVGNNPSGWVNIGVHAVKLDLMDGDLRIEVCARTNEGDPLAVASVTKAASIATGGVGPDVED